MEPENHMDNQSSNPLIKHFRQPALYLKLPSSGNYWPAGSINLTGSGEVAVYPMTTREEIIIRTPDALMNGEGVVKVIQNCCPDITNAWDMPSIDVDAVLIAIRIASYGQDMDVDSKCPACEAENNHAVDLNYALANVRSPDYTELVTDTDIKIKLKPQKYFDVNRRNRILFEEQRILATVTDDSLAEDEKVKRYNTYLTNLVDLNMSLLATSTQNIMTSDGLEVDDPEYILEYYNNAPGQMIRRIQKQMEKFNEDAKLPKMRLECTECAHVYDLALEFDYSNFFAVGS